MDLNHTNGCVPSPELLRRQVVTIAWDRVRDRGKIKVRVTIYAILIIPLYECFRKEKRLGRVFTKHVFTLGLEYLRDGVRYSMYRRLLQRHAVVRGLV